MLSSIRGRGVHKLQVVADRLAELGEDTTCIMIGRVADRARCCTDALSRIGLWQLGRDERARLWAWAYSTIKEHSRTGSPVEWGNIPHPDGMVPEANTWCGATVARFFDYDCYRSRNDRVRAAIVNVQFVGAPLLHYDCRGIWKPREFGPDEAGRDYAWRIFDLVVDYHARGGAR